VATPAPTRAVPRCRGPAPRAGLEGPIPRNAGHRPPRPYAWYSCLCSGLWWSAVGSGEHRTHRAKDVSEDPKGSLVGPTACGILSSCWFWVLGLCSQAGRQPAKHTYYPSEGGKKMNKNDAKAKHGVRKHSHLACLYGPAYCKCKCCLVFYFTETAGALPLH
jgi:hypothetical protein